MNAQDKNRADMQSLGLIGSILFLLLHVYHHCFTYFRSAGFGGAFSDQLMIVIARTGLFNHPYTAKLLSLAALLISILLTQGRKDGTRGWRYGLGMIGGGLVVYFLIDLTLPYLQGGWTMGYLAVTAAGYIMIVHGGHSLARIMPGLFQSEDAFGRQHMGFPQDEKKRVGDLSINLPARYLIRGKERSSWVNLINPRRGVMIVGTPGCGKSRFVIEPIMRQVISKGMAVFLYDYKYDVLSRQAYALFQEYHAKYPPGAGFRCINFSDLSRSHRCNVLDPATLSYLSDAIGISKTILFSLNKSWVHKQGDFFVDSPVMFLTAVIWWLRCYEKGKYCTLPHVIELCGQPYDKLFSILRTQPECERVINPFVQAYVNQAKDMLEGQLASIKIPLSKLASSDLYYILTDPDCELSINDPAKPLVFCLGGQPSRSEALAPILSLFVDRINQLVNQPGRHPVALIYDEFPTLRAYSIIQTVATARSNNVIPVLSVQDLSQLRLQYSPDEANAILSTCGNFLCGQVSGDTAKWVSEHFLKLWQQRTTMNVNSQDTSLSHSRQWEEAVSPATMAHLSSGEFVGVVADDPDMPLELKGFHARIQREGEDRVVGVLPVVRTVNPDVVQQAFRRVREDVETLVNEVYDKMERSTDLRALIVRGRPANF